MENLDLTPILSSLPDSNTYDWLQVHSIGVIERKTVKLLATEILDVFIRIRRMDRSNEACDSRTCSSCSAPHLPKIISAITQGKPIQFVLPAFPGKSPNLNKVLGHLPDMAERQALQFLNNACEQINRLYKPGAEIIICSDGRVFSDVIGISDQHLTAYQATLDQLIKDLDLRNLSTFSLDELSQDNDFTQLRRNLMSKYGQPIEVLQEKVRRGGSGSATSEENDVHRMYCGITRFLFEDALFPGQIKSRTAIQKVCRVNAYEVVRRSGAWSEVIAENFPEAIRLSIHPQLCGSHKLGIQLLGRHAWLTPWHGVAVDTVVGFTLMKRIEAEALRAKLIRDVDGRPSHFELHNEESAL